MQKTKSLLILGVVSCCLIFAGTVNAYDQPSVNLGFTSFLDGGPPAGPGLYFTEYLQYYTSDQLNDENGDALNLPDPDLDVFVSLSQFIYQSNDVTILNGKWGLDVIIPVVHISAEYGEDGPFPSDNGTGFGDILIGPFLQWDPIMGENGPLFMQRVELQMIFPSGKYDDDRELNPGSGFFSFNPYWAGTYFITPRATTSLRLHYLWNAENDEPNRAFAGADDSQAGQAVHANFAAAYEVMPKTLRVGLNGYFFDQITDTRVDGESVDGRKEKVVGIGVGALYHISQDQHLFFNIFAETLAENRPEGTRTTLRYVHHF